MPARSSLVVQKPIETAREMLGQCLGKLQDIAYPGLNVQILIEKVAGTVRTLFDIGKYDAIEKPHREGIRKAMELIGQSLGILQDTETKDPAVFEASKIMARVLSILYPISKAQETYAQRKEAAVPLVAKKTPLARPVQPHPQRTMPRMTLNVDIGMQSENNFYTGFSEDISEGGIFITTYDFKPIGTRINISFTMPSGHVVMTSGTVKWIREFNPMTPNMPPGMGIQFDDLSGEDRSQIQEYLSLKAPMFYES